MMQLIVQLFIARGDFCCLLITFANSLILDQNRQNVSPDLDLNRLTFKDFFENNFEKSPGPTAKA